MVQQDPNLKDLLLSYFPSNRNEQMADIDRYIALSLSLTFKREGERLIAYRDGKAITDPLTHAPLPAKDVISAYFTERGWVSSNTQADKIDTFSKFEKKWTEENPGKNTLCPEFIDAINSHAKSVENFDRYN